MSSDLWQAKIQPYVDAELPDSEMRAMDAHLRECASCAAEALHLVQLKNATKVAARRFTPSPEFRRKIASQISSQAAVRKPSSWRWMWAPLIAVSAALLLAAALWMNHSSEQARSHQLLAELTDLHVANLAAATPVDVVSSDRHTVKPWFQGKVPFSFNLPEFANTPFTLLGGRLTYLDHEPGAHLICNAGAHHISVFIFQDQPELAHAFAAQQSSRDLLNFHVESWSTSGLRYFVVGDANPQSIHDLSAMLEKANQ